MVQIENTIVSFDLFDKHFLCDLAACKGICCIEGDSGAPLTKEEAQKIEACYPVFEKYLDQKYKDEVSKQGYSVIDSDGDIVTPLYNNRECVYTFTDENGCTKCAIEKAFLNKEVDFHKPVSCHLFPVRVTEYADFDALNYQQLDICKCAVKNGDKHKIPLYKMLKGPLVRKYGSDWYEQLEYAAENLNM